ncbi:MAG: RrF2 family transcriptional regulator [Bacteroidota bacterium]
MTGILHISRAASIGIHGTVLIHKSKVRLNAAQIASQLNASEHHVAKVLQKLAKGNILNSQKGPAGGFSLARPARHINLLEIYEAVEGPLSENICPENAEICPFDNCLWGNFGRKTGKNFKTYLQEKLLAEL